MPGGPFLERAAARLVDPAFVTKDPALLPWHRHRQLVVHELSLRHQAAHDIDPCAAAEIDTFSTCRLVEPGRSCAELRHVAKVRGVRLQSPTMYPGHHA